MDGQTVPLTNQVFVLLWVFGWAAFFLILWLLRAKREQQRLELIHKERLIAMEKGVPFPELPDYEPSTKRSLAQELRTYANVNPRWPLGVGAICIMLGIGVALALRLSGEEYHQRVWSFGLIGIFLGAGLFLHYFLTRETKE